MLEEQIENKTLALVIVGFEINSIERFKQIIESKKIIKENGFTTGQYLFIQAPPGAPQFPISYKIKNDKFLTIQYNLLEKKLIITQENYREHSYSNDETILLILKTLLTLTPAASLIAFGVNYSTDISRQNKLSLFNKDIEKQLSQNFWDTNIGFKTELAFQNDEYTSVYRIFKNEKISQEKGIRLYTFDTNFDFTLNDDDNAEKIIKIFKNNNKYFNIYEENVGNILKL